MKEWKDNFSDELQENEKKDFFGLLQWWEHDFGNDNSPEGIKSKQVAKDFNQKSGEIINWIKKRIRDMKSTEYQSGKRDHLKDMLEELFPEMDIEELPGYDNLVYSFNMQIVELDT